MSPVSKDLAIGAIVLGACLTLVGFAFLKPGSDEEPGEGPKRPPAEQAQRPPGGGVGSDDVAEGGDRIDDTIGNLLADNANQVAEEREREQPIDIEEVIGGSRHERSPAPHGDGGASESTGPLPAPAPGPAQEGDRNGGERPNPASDESEPLGPSRRIHVVAAGETYQTISERYYGTTREWRRIADANDIGEYDLRVGMKLEIPKAPRAGGESGRGTGGSGQRTHVVAAGETYQTISERYYGTTREWRRIADANDIGEYDLRVGMKLRIPPAPADDRRAAADGSAGAAGRVVHVVAAHEFLGDISLKYYGTTRRWQQIADANGIEDPTSLKEGTRLVIPRLSHEADGRTPVVATIPVGTSHTVSSGETLETISRRYLGKKSRWRQIAAANPGIDPRRLMVGQKILIPRVERPETLVPTGSRETAPAPASAPRPETGRREPATPPDRDPGELIRPVIPPPSAEESDDPAPLPWE